MTIAIVAREQVYQALLDLLTTTGDFKLVSRRNRAPESITPDLSPALFLFERGETYHVVSPSVPPKRCLEVFAIFYNDVGSDLNGVPTALINAALDNLDAALKPDPATGRTTLGGLVYSCRANGAVEKAPGDREGRRSPWSRSKSFSPEKGQAAMYIFGSGVITATINNAPGGIATPLNIGLAQEISFDESYTTKTLYGQYRRPVAIGAGEIKATGKIKAARFSASVMGALLYGKPVVAGSITTAFAEAASIPASTPFTVTVVNSTTWTADQGVQDAVTGFPYTHVSGTPLTGQYSVAAGVYTFAAVDTGKALLISYNYSSTTAGFSLAIGNPLLGPTQTFGLNVMCTDPVTNKVGTYQIYNAVIAKFAMATKLSDFAMPEYDYEAFANASNQFGQWNFPDPA